MPHAFLTTPGQKRRAMRQGSVQTFCNMAKKVRSLCLSERRVTTRRLMMWKNVFQGVSFLLARNGGSRKTYRGNRQQVGHKGVEPQRPQRQRQIGPDRTLRYKGN